MSGRLPLLGAILAAAAGLWLVGSGGWIHAKAMLASQLIERAWDQRLAGAERPRPWPWADTWPVARLNFPKQNRLITVLAGAQGATLAFGPGHLTGTATPGAPGNAIIAGHRDTSFRFFGALSPGDPVRLQSANGKWKTYRVTGRMIVDTRQSWSPPEPGPDSSMLTLVTCWPLDAIIPGGPERLLIFAEEDPPGAPA